MTDLLHFVALVGHFVVSRKSLDTDSEGRLAHAGPSLTFTLHNH